MGSPAWREWSRLFMPVTVVSGLNKCFSISLQKKSCNSLHGICLDRGQSQPMQWLLVSSFPSLWFQWLELKLPASGPACCTSYQHRSHQSSQVTARQQFSAAVAHGAAWELPVKLGGFTAPAQHDSDVISQSSRSLLWKHSGKTHNLAI